MLERTRTAERYARGFAAALVAMATLLLAANAGPAQTADARPPRPATPVTDAGAATSH
ncbi:hypothetical protein [Streptomyces dubilierae]|uniref:Uncharacterized protein n=1 Tax=Streptomyces dubilierae TaxID=3075533 RepID=A0ABU2PAA4_9ACTN|nr:hypothetical protein [Streptomyces sp. DSM 41921]MDT0389078.1 hypothetical protein [Streptomyces sp. DSM 41921]